MYFALPGLIQLKSRRPSGLSSLGMFPFHPIRSSRFQALHQLIEGPETISQTQTYMHTYKDPCEADLCTHQALYLCAVRTPISVHSSNPLSCLLKWLAILQRPPQTLLPERSTFSSPQHPPSFLLGSPQDSWLECTFTRGSPHSLGMSHFSFLISERGDTFPSSK